MQLAFRTVSEAMGNAEAMGKAGWTVPANASLADCVRLLREATDGARADAAFVEFYSAEGGMNLAILLADLRQRTHLNDFRGLLDEIAFTIETRKFRVAAPALLATFEGVLRRCWSDGSWTQSARDNFFKAKLKDFEKESPDWIFWCATKAFIDTLYAPNWAGDPKPTTINRHWVMHGRGPAEGTLADCLRLLQAIQTVLILAEEEHELAPSSGNHTDQ